MRDLPTFIAFVLSVAMFLVLMVILSGCSPTVVVQYRCPVLSNPPPAIVDTLEATGRKDPSAASWVIDLDKHYQKCDVINQQRAKT